jgi:Flagellar biosynthesis protein, FliO
MKSEATLHEAGFCDVSNRMTAASPPQFDLWRRARSVWERVLGWSRRRPRRLRLCESLPLGERRFVAVVEFERSRFLVGGTSGSLVLLARLENAPEEDESAASVSDPIEISNEVRR